MSSISIGLAAARQAAAIGPNAQKPAQPAPTPAPAGGCATCKPMTPAKPAGTGLLVDTRA